MRITKARCGAGSSARISPPYAVATVAWAASAARALLDGFAAHLNEAGLGTVSEIFDAEPPFAPRGCIAQAWSVGELLRAGVEDVGELGV